MTSPDILLERDVGRNRRNPHSNSQKDGKLVWFFKVNLSELKWDLLYLSLLFDPFWLTILEWWGITDWFSSSVSKCTNVKMIEEVLPHKWPIYFEKISSTAFPWTMPIKYRESPSWPLMTTSIYLWIFTRRAWPRGLPWPLKSRSVDNNANLSKPGRVQWDTWNQANEQYNSLITGGFFLAACSFTWASLSRRGDSRCGIETVIHDYRVVVVWLFWLRKKIRNASSTSCEEKQPHLPSRTVRIRWFLGKKTNGARFVLGARHI